MEALGRCNNLYASKGCNVEEALAVLDAFPQGVEDIRRTIANAAKGERVIEPQRAPMTVQAYLLKLFLQDSTTAANVAKSFIVQRDNNPDEHTKYVILSLNCGSLMCSCDSYISDGLVCSHILRAFKDEHIALNLALHTRDHWLGNAARALAADERVAKCTMNKARTKLSATKITTGTHYGAFANYCRREWLGDGVVREMEKAAAGDDAADDDNSVSDEGLDVAARQDPVLASNKTAYRIAAGVKAAEVVTLSRQVQELAGGRWGGEALEALDLAKEVLQDFMSHVEEAETAGDGIQVSARLNPSGRRQNRKLSMHEKVRKKMKATEAARRKKAANGPSAASPLRKKNRNEALLRATARPSDKKSRKKMKIES